MKLSWRAIQAPSGLPACQTGSLKMSARHFLDAPSCPHKEALHIEGQVSWHLDCEIVSYNSGNKISFIYGNLSCLFFLQQIEKIL